MSLIRRPWSVLVLALFLGSVAVAAQPSAEPDQRTQLLRRILNENIVSFWHPGVLDREGGGYHLNHDVHGKWLGPSPRTLVTQSRTVWFFSRLYNTGLGKQEHLDAAAHGYRFLRDVMWDREHGGFFWEVDPAGNPTRPAKHLYAQSFGLYALSEYAMASRDPEALDLARRLFAILDYHAYDRQHGGYLEFFQSDWSPLKEELQGYMSADPSTKLMNTHLHLMEAFTTYYRASRDPLARERLVELIFIQSNAVVRKDIGACTDRYARDWTPLRGGFFDRVSYGHDVENVWLLMDACDAAGISNGPLMDLYRTLFAYSLKYGYDDQQGGFYDSGRFNQPADRKAKVWWTQAEALVAALRMHRMTGEQRYLDVFDQTLEWVRRHQVDWENGDWHANIGEDGKPSGQKAGPWKSPYHNGRAMIECLLLLSQPVRQP
jgi:cellobiose epimerase